MCYGFTLQVELPMKIFVSFDTTYLVNRYEMPFGAFIGVNHHGHSILLGCALVVNEDSGSFK